jgi:hypothetical protein
MKKDEMEELVRSGQAFRLKSEDEPEVVPLTLEEVVELAYRLKAEKSAAEKRFNEAKNLIKAELDRQGVDTYETSTGTKVRLTKTERVSYNRELLMELLGEDYTKAVKISKSTRFELKK